MRNSGLSTRKIAKQIGVPKSTLWDFYNRERLQPYQPPQGAKLLFLDVEVSPTIAACFGRFNTNISPKHVIEEPYMLTYAWADRVDGAVSVDKLSDHALFKYDFRNDFNLVSGLHSLLDNADIVIAHNAGFDVGWFNQRCLYWGMSIPSPYKVVCTLRAIRQAFSLPANSLEAAANYFSLPKKLDNSGISLWIDCYNGNSSAFNTMADYNVGDIVTLQALYKAVLPYMKSHPNMSLYHSDSDSRCNKCGSSNLHNTGMHHYTGSAKYEVWKCGDCQSNVTFKDNLLEKDKRKSLARGVL
jgi:hypothetical protein